VRTPPRLACALLAAALAGCAQPDPGKVTARPPRPVDRVDHIYQDLYPAAVSLDDVPGTDGLRTIVTFYRLDRPLPVAVTGKLEFFLFEGRVRREEVEARKPLRVWSFSRAQLARRAARLKPGWGYAFVLSWGKDVPTSRVITLSARYTPPEGPPLYGKPISIPMKR